MQIAGAWDGSLKSMKDLGKSVVLRTVAWAIWIPSYVISAAVAWIVLRRPSALYYEIVPGWSHSQPRQSARGMCPGPAYEVARSSGSRSRFTAALL